MLAPAENQIVLDDFFEMPVSDNEPHDVPGWEELEIFLRATLGMVDNLAIESFRKFYNHYLKRFPVHYFSEKTIPEINFALHFPVNGRRKGINHSHYLTALSIKGKPLIIFARKIPTHVKSRKNFYMYTLRLINDGKFFDVEHIDNVLEIEKICANPGELHRSRSARFHGFLMKAERKFHKTRHRRYFKGKWDAIRDYLDQRDRAYIEALIERIKTHHLSFEAAHMAAKICGSQNLGLYNWMAAAATPEILRNRMQLSEIFPWLARALADDKHRKEYAHLEKSIDQGERLIPELQDVFGDAAGDEVSQSAIRKTMWLDLSPATRYQPVLKNLMQGISTYLPHFSLQPGYMERFSSAYETAGETFRYLNSNFFEVFAAMSPEEQQAFLTGDIAAIPRTYANAIDYLSVVYRTTVLPYFVDQALAHGHEGLGDLNERYIKGTLELESFVIRNRHQRPHPPYLRPMSNVSFPTMVHLSEHWHNNMGRYTAKRRGLDVDSELQWPKIIPEPVTAPNGVKIEELDSKTALFKEHEEMRHCVYEYAPKCLGLIFDQTRPHTRAYSHVFRTSAGGGSRARATMELLEPYHQQRPKLKFTQLENRRTIKDVKNIPDAKAAESVAAKWFVENLNNGKIPVDWDRVYAERKRTGAGKPLSQMFNLIGFDPRDPIKREEAFLILRPYLPERFRTSSYAEWVGKMGFEAEAKTMFSGKHAGDPYALVYQ